MPELPEVETIRRGLADRVQGRRIVRAELSLPKLLRGAAIADLGQLEGRAILSLTRRAKYLLLNVEGPLTLTVHLGMSGQLTWWDPALEDAAGFMRHRHTGLQKTASQHARDKHTHFILHLEGGQRVQYRDPRQFGHLRLLATPELPKTPPFDSLGPEPLEAAFTASSLVERLMARRGRLKALLLDQHLVAGVGNIYADEALYGAQLHPLRLAQSLKPEECKALWASLRAVLRKGIAQGGSSISDFINAEGGKGSNQESLKAYGRAGLPCLRCGTPMQHTLVSQRSTVFCPNCQCLRKKR